MSSSVPSSSEYRAASSSSPKATSTKEDEKKLEVLKPIDVNFTTIFITKDAYQYVSDEFHPFHKHDLNVLVHFFTSGLGVWGAIQLAVLYNLPIAIYIYTALVAITTPATTTAALHTLFVYLCLCISPAKLVEFVGGSVGIMPMLSTVQPLMVCVAAIVIGFTLQELSHIVFCEKTYMGHYMDASNVQNFKPWMLVVHTIWLMPLVIDSIMMRHFYLSFVPTRNRLIVCPVASTQAVDEIQKWITDNVPETAETTHIWPHKQEGTAKQTLALETDAGIYAAFRKVFPAKHYDVMPVQGMNEIYVTAVGAKREINSDAVFYTPHTDGPYWFLPGASLYRVLVGVTPNTMVRTRFNLQHESQDQVLDIHGVVGFDYNRELHWIDHVPGAKNTQRRSLMKLHYIVYPTGWHSYGKLCAYLNASYNTMARNNFLRTLRPTTTIAWINAWFIWLTTYFNAIFEEHIGYSNLVYVALAYSLGSTPFLLLTSFRHYVLYITTFAFRKPSVAHGYLMRDAKLYKTISMIHLAYRLLPMVQYNKVSDMIGLGIACLGFATTLLATHRLGMVRTYFGTELGYVKPCWVDGFPYGTIPHPMINGQIFAFSIILLWWWNDITINNKYLLFAHIGFYATHMIQEIIAGAY
jgi:hypothetical protein